MANKFLKIAIAIALSIGTFTLLEANSYYEKNYNNSTINLPSSKNDRIFIREYNYNVSDTDSKVSSRKKAIAQLKSILSEEVGVHIQSSFDVKKTSHNKYVKKEINQLSASITKLKIIEEKWNGVTYYIKASVKINEEQTMNLLLEAIKAKSSQKDVKRLNKILKEQNGNLDKSYSKIKQLQKKLVLQEIKNQASKDELSDTKKLLLKLKKDIKKYDNEIIKKKKLEKLYKTELEKKKAIIKNLNAKTKNKITEQKKEWLNTLELLSSFEIGTSKRDIIRIAGIPDIPKIDNKFLGSYNTYKEPGGKSVRFETDIYHNRVCPTNFLNSQGYNCIYFEFKDDLLVKCSKGLYHSGYL